MDLGIAGRTALVTGASKGLGRACALALAREGVKLTITARNAERLEKAAMDIRAATGVDVRTAVGDITTPTGRDAAIQACPSADILVNNAGDAPPRGNCLQWDDDMWMKAVRAHMLTSIGLMRAIIPGMVERGFGRVVNITSGVVKMPIGNMLLANAPRVGLTGFVAGLSRETIRHNVTINNLLPGAMDTDRFAEHRKHMASAADNPANANESAKITAVPAGRWGKPEEFGAVCAFLCSAHAGFLTGQNISHDGGRFPGIF